jgi:ABC-type transport system, involved in lipoprotein release, permease component
MSLLAFTIAWRNLWRHRGKSIVIGVILFFGTLLMTVGNGFISGMEKGLSENIVNLFTGDIVVISNEQEKDDVLFEMMGKPLKVIKNFDAAKKVLAKEAFIQKFLPATAGMVFVLNPGSDMGNIMLLGVDIDKYRAMFPNSIKVTDGGLFKPGERGVLVAEEARKQAWDFMDFWIIPQGEVLNRKKLPADMRGVADLDVSNSLVFMGTSTSNSTMDIRVPVKGIIKYKALNKIWGNYCIVDIESFREAHNYVTGADSKVEIPKEEKKLLESDNLDQIFGSGDIIDKSVVTNESISVKDIQAQTQRKVTEYNPDAGSYNLAFIKLKPGISQTVALNMLNREFRQQHLNVRAVSWKSSVGTIGSMAMMVKAALNTFIMFIFFVAIIVIMNTLSMAAIERVSEIGMMRAIGARKGFMRKMFVYETGLLSFFFGGLGIIAGIAVVYLLRAAGISTTNEILQLVYGGEQLSPIFTMADFFLGIVELGIVTFLSVLYPLRVVGKIVPLDAISRD